MAGLENKYAVNPARAGMILKNAIEKGEQFSKPRASGDDPPPIDMIGDDF